MARRAAKPDVAALEEAVARAVAKSRTPPKPGMTSWPFTFPQEHFTKDDWQLFASLVRYVRTEERALFRKFLHERTIADLTVSFLMNTPRTPTLRRLVTHLREQATSETRWLIEVPVYNLKLPNETVLLGSAAMLVESDSRREAPRWGSHFKNIWAVRDHLDDELVTHGRWLRAAPPWQDQEIDTRIMASFLLVEEGTDAVALSLAESRARYALAMWCLFRPPRPSKTRRPLWPHSGYWMPGTFLRLGALHKTYEPGVFPGTAPRRGSSIVEYGPYRLTNNVSHQEAPLAAMRHALKGNQCALALLSASRSLYLAANPTIDLDRTERVMHLWTALEAICDRGRRGQGSAEERWQRLVKNLRLKTALRRAGYTQIEVDEAFEALHVLRDLSTHRADDVLVNMNFPDGRLVSLHKGRTATADTVALAMVTSQTPILYRAIRTATLSLARQAIRTDWDENAFLARFAP